MQFKGRELDPLRALDFKQRLRWVADNFPAGRAGISTSFQHSGMVLVDARCELKLDAIRVYTIDTERLITDIYMFMDKVEQYYGISIERHRPDPDEVERMVKQHGLYLFFDSKEKQEFCCGVRKIKPHNKVLDTLDVWITGLRREQSDTRAETPLYQVIERKAGPVLKLNPLFDWSDEQIIAYTRERNIPVCPLYEQGYPSFSCEICTTPVLPHEDKRAGRWRWFNRTGHNKECGLHVNDKQISPY